MSNSINMVFMLWLVFAPLGLYYVINTWTMTSDTIGYKAALFFGNVAVYYLWLYAFVTNLRSIMYLEILKDAYDDIREQVEQELQVASDSDQDEMPALETIVKSVQTADALNEMHALEPAVESVQMVEDESEDSSSEAPENVPAQSDTIPIAVPL